jgi:serine/threonine-protein kinase
MVCLLRVGFDDAEEPDEALLAPGADRLGNYRIERRDDGTPWELGRGAMGVTYRAIDTSLQRPVALKLIDSEWVKRGAEARERFMREARAAAALRHPNVATVYHFGIREENGQFFCAMELVEGETLEMRVRRTGPLDALTTIEIALQVSSALAAAEKQGLVHRDLKPGNLMLVESEGDATIAVKVIDFGVAKALSEKPDAMGLTHGGFVGTPAFASPEQFTDSQVDVRSDIYSLGATLWYLLTGNRPSEGASLHEIRAAQQRGVLPAEQLKLAHVPSRLRSLLLSTLALEPAARPGVRTLIAKLQECRAQILDRWKLPRRVAIASLVPGLIAAAFLTFVSWRNQNGSQNPALANLPEKSIAVLPFQNLSDDKNDAFLANGIHEDILSSLSKIADLKLTSSASVLQYRNPGQGGRDLRAIANTLGVRNLLEGSIRRTADRLLIKVQLTDASRDRLVWAERYDRSIADSITLQGELAMEIASALRARLSAEERTSAAVKPTQNAEAYVAYLRGLEHKSGTATFKGLEKLRLQERFFEQAVALDRDFALAHAQLSQTLAYIYHDFDPTEETRRRARAAAETALRLQPNLGEGHFADALCLYWTEKDYEGAVRGFAKAAQLLPNRAEVEAWGSFVRRRQGRWKEALEGFERALERDPRNKAVLSGYFATQYFLRDWPAARRASERAIAAASDTPTLMRIEKGYLSVWSAGDLRPLRESLAGVAAGVDPDGGVTLARWDAAMMAKDYVAAEGAVKESTLDIILMGHGTPVPKAYLLGCVALARGDSVGAQKIFAEARPRMEAEAAGAPLEPFRHAQLGLLYAFMHRKEDAIREGERAVELAPIKEDAIYGAQMLGLLAAIYAQTGEHDRALGLIERLLVAPAAVLPAFEGSITLNELKLRWHWDPLRGDSRFKEILASPEPVTTYLARSPDGGADAPEKSIAVLPFENRSEDQENAFFADAIQDDVLTSLVKIKELKVIGRASVMSYREGTKRNLRDIGRELGVAHVLEGTVRRVSDRMLIHVNLTDTRNGRAVWAERYDRTLVDFARLQGELAIEIAGALRMKLAPETKASLELKPTENPDAYVFYLRGREYQMRPETSQDNYLAAENFYKQAITLDPRFALAYARLAVIQNNLYIRFDHRPARIAEARSNAKEAIRLDPDCGQGHMALAGVTFETEGPPEEVKREIATAVRLLPNDAYVVMDAAHYQDRMGLFHDAVASYERAIVLNPREGKIVYNYGVALYEHNEIPRARSALDRALELSPESVYFRVFRARVEIEWTGDVASAKAILAKLPKGKDPDGRATAAHCSIALFERNFSEALRLLGDCSVDRLPLGTGFGPMVPKNYIKGLVQFYAGDREAAYTTLDSIRWMIEVEAREKAGDTETHFLLAVAYAAMGWADAAKAETGRTKEKMDDFQMAVILAHLRQEEPTLSALERANVTPEYKNVFLRLDPDWDFVRQHPRFQKLLTQAAAAVRDASKKQ